MNFLGKYYLFHAEKILNKIKQKGSTGTIGFIVLCLFYDPFRGS